MRKHWIDNLRWFTVVLVMLYHVFYFFNSKGVFGGIGPFDPNPEGQPQDIVLYILYPWFMMLLFLLAGISARYSLQKRSSREFSRSRSLKLLVPATVGLFVFQWIVGYVNTLSPEAQASISAAPGPVKWIIWSISGIGPLWFAQELWLFSMLLLMIRRLDHDNRFYNWCSRTTYSLRLIVTFGLLMFLSSQFMLESSEDKPFSGLVNLYRPVAYFVPFLLGYFVFSSEEVMQRVKNICVPMSILAVCDGIAFCFGFWGEDYTSKEVLTSVFTTLYAWPAILALMGLFMRCADKTNGFCSYMTRSSYGFYVLHYAVMAVVGYYLKTSTNLAPWAVYALLIVIVFLGTPALYELLRRIPFLRWAILGQRGKRLK